MVAQFSPAIKGVVRFSYPSEGGFAVEHDTAAAQEAFLFDRARLERRFALFEALTLPSLKMQTDKDFQVAILVGQGLPGWAMSRLQDLLSDLPQAHLIALPRMSHYPATREALERMPHPGGTTHIAGFRLDDDDAMHKDTVARIRHLSHAIAPVAAPDQPFAIGFNRGVFLGLTPQGHTVDVVAERTPIGIGLTLVVPVAQRTNIFRRNHRLLHQFYDCFTEANRIMFIRSVHGDNDSGAVSTGGRDKKIPADQLNAVLQEGFGLTLAQLKEL